MKKLKKIFKSNQLKNLLTVFVVVALTIVVKSSSASGNATLTFEPNSGTKTKGTTFSVTLKVNSDTEPVSSVRANLTYDPTKLQYLSANTTTGAYSTCIGVGGGNGSITIPCTKLGGSTTSKQTVAVVSFKVLSGTGSAEIKFASSSSVKSASDGTQIWDGNANAALFTLKRAASTGGTKKPKPTSPTTSTTTKTTSGSTSSGTSSSTSGSSSSTSGTSSPSDTTIPEGSNVVPTAVLSANIAVHVTDNDGQAVAGAKVWIDNNVAITDASGTASFSGVSPGKYKVKVEATKGSAGKDITVDSSTNGEVQRVELKIKKSINFLLWGGLALVAILALVLISLIRRKLKERKSFSRHFQHMDKKPVVEDMSEKRKAPNETVAAVVTPGSKSKDEEEKEAEDALEKPKPNFESSDTLEEIERKVGAKKAKPAHAGADAADFTPTLITPKKPTKTVDHDN